jgi:N-hydroxyarylamine O-acetyltransferase
VKLESIPAIDIESYLARIGYKGDRAPTLETLQAIHKQHTQTIAFENLNSFLKQPVTLDLESLQQKLIHKGRGGYCFEQNLLLRSVLIALGFQVTNLTARVLWNIPEGTVTARGHMLLQVDIDAKPYIADVGFGSLTLTAPLALIPDIEQSTPHEAFRLVKVGDRTYIMQASIGQEWKPLYRFDLQAQHLIDYEVSNWYISTHPKSMFTNTLIVAKPDFGCRYALRNNQFTIHHLHGQTKRRSLKTVTELRTVLEDVFHLTLPEFADSHIAFQRLVEQTESES